MTLAGTGNCTAVVRHRAGLACHHDGRAGSTSLLVPTQSVVTKRRQEGTVIVPDNPPETKGKTLEEVQEMWADPAELHRAIHTWR